MGKGGLLPEYCWSLPLEGRTDKTPQPLLDALDHLCLQVEDDPEVQRNFYIANTPEQIVQLSVELGILIEAEDFRALLRSGSTERWFLRGGDQTNPITHLKRVFHV